MTRRKKRKLVRRAKEAAVLGAMLYLAAGITVTGKDEEPEKKVVYARDIRSITGDPARRAGRNGGAGGYSSSQHEPSEIRYRFT